MTANGLSSRALRRRSSATASSVGRVDDEVVAADPLDRHDRPGAQRAGDRGERVAPVRPARRPTVRSPRHVRPARRTGVGLGVEATVGGIVVLAPAGRAHGEAGHRGGGPVVGHARHDRVAGAAAGAVGERVAVAAVGRVHHLGEAVGAGRGVDADGRGRRRRPPSLRSIRNPDAAPLGGIASVVTAATEASGGGSSTSTRASRSMCSGGSLHLDQDPGSGRCARTRRARAPGRGGRRRGGTPRPGRCP